MIFFSTGNGLADLLVGNKYLYNLEEDQLVSISLFSCFHNFDLSDWLFCLLFWRLWVHQQMKWTRSFIAWDMQRNAWIYFVQNHCISLERSLLWKMRQVNTFQRRDFLRITYFHKMEHFKFVNFFSFRRNCWGWSREIFPPVCLFVVPFKIFPFQPFCWKYSSKLLVNRRPLWAKNTFPGCCRQCLSPVLHPGFVKQYISKFCAHK